MKPCIIYLVRHGQSEANSQKIVSGHFDTPLTELGKEQAAAAAAKLSDVTFDAVYSSDLQRAIHTAGIIAGKPVPTDQQITQLRERHFGQYEGKHNARFQADVDTHTEQIKGLDDKTRWRNSHVKGVESDQELSERFVSALEDIAKNHPGQTILVAAHGGAIRTTLIAIGYATIDELPSGSLENTGYAEIQYDDSGFKVMSVSGVNKLLKSVE